MTQPILSFVIVTYNNTTTIEACLSSIAAHTREPYEVVIVDNSPNPGTVEVIEQYRVVHPGQNVRLLRPETNIGFGRACNLGAQATHGEYLFILNPDTQLLNNAASTLMQCLVTQPKAVAAGPAILSEQGVVTKTCRRLPTLFRVMLDATGIDAWLGLYKMTRFAHDKAAQVEQIIGAAILIRRGDYMNAGGMDPQFFVYFEEVDLCKRLQEAGGAIWFWPDAKVQHLGGGSCEVGPVRARMIFTLRESRTKYFKKHGGAFAALVSTCINRLEGAGKAFVFGVMSKFRRSQSYPDKAWGFWSVATSRPPHTRAAKPFRVLAFTVKPRESADSRYRMLQYFTVAQRDGIQVTHRTLMGRRYFQWQIRNVCLVPRLLLLPFLLLNRLWQVLWLAPQFDSVWILREMFPIGPPILEQLLVWRCKRIVLDVDDALHIPDKQSSRMWLRLLRDQGKFARMASSYNSIVCGNTYLGEFYASKGARVHIVPTVVDTDRYANCSRDNASVPRIGWIGTPLNRHHLEMLTDVFQRLAAEHRFEFVVVGLNEPLDWQVPGVRYLDWTLRNELDFFSQFDIGIMPLIDSPFARGKCAFKLVQYMAAGLPVIASPVGANRDLVEHGLNGFLADTEAEWHQALAALIQDPDLRTKMGEHGRSLVRRCYSVQEVWPRYSTILTGSL